MHMTEVNAFSAGNTFFIVYFWRPSDLISRDAFECVLRHFPSCFKSILSRLKPFLNLFKKRLKPDAGCIAGTEVKDKYLELIGQAGFQEIKVIDEKAYRFECIISEKTLLRAIKLTRMTKEELKVAAEIIVSVKVSAQKK